MPFVEVRGAIKHRGRRTIWCDLDLDVAAGEMLAVTGPSGSGKSTLLDCLGLIDRLDAGAIVFDGRQSSQLHERGRRLLRRDLLGYLFQNYGLVDDATVAANLDIVRPSGMRRSARRAEQKAALDRVGMADRIDDPVHELSGGEQQRVALARLIVKRPRVVLADEPTGALDIDNARIVLDVLREHAADGAAVIIATHSKSVVDACDRSFDVSGTVLPNTTKARTGEAPRS